MRGLEIAHFLIVVVEITPYNDATFSIESLHKMIPMDARHVIFGCTTRLQCYK